MDEALEKLLRVSSDGAYFIGSLQVTKNQRAKPTFVLKVRAHACPPSSYE